MLKILFLFLVSTKGQRRDKSETVTKFVGIVVAIIFVTNLSQIPLWNATRCFFTDHLKRNTVERPQQILTNNVYISRRAFQLLWLFFEAFRIFWIIWQSIFVHI